VQENQKKHTDDALQFDATSKSSTILKKKEKQIYTPHRSMSSNLKKKEKHMDGIIKSEEKKRSIWMGSLFKMACDLCLLGARSISASLPRDISGCSPCYRRGRPGAAACSQAGKP
jgi:hypothetical protein